MNKFLNKKKFDKSLFIHIYRFLAKNILIVKMKFGLYNKKLLPLYLF